MLNNFNLIKTCFDSDDDDTEKFGIKNNFLSNIFS